MTHPRRGLRALLLTGLLLLIPASLRPPETQAAIPVIDGANLSQNIRTALAQIRAIEQRIEILTTQIDQYRWMLAQIEGLEDPTFREIGRLLAQIERVVSDTEGLVYTLPHTSQRFLETRVQVRGYHKTFTGNDGRKHTHFIVTAYKLLRLKRPPQEHLREVRACA